MIGTLFDTVLWLAEKDEDTGEFVGPWTKVEDLEPMGAVELSGHLARVVVRWLVGA